MIYYSKYDLNTYRSTSYFDAHLPADYPLGMVLAKCRMFHALPPRLRRLSALAKRWATRHAPIVVEEVSKWYSPDGYELDPDTGKHLTEEQIEELWPKPDEALKKFEVTDIPLPPGGFADPDTWVPPPEVEESDEDSDYTAPTEERLLSEIKSHGREYTARYYGVPMDGIKSDRALAAAIRSAHPQHTAG